MKLTFKLWPIVPKSDYKRFPDKIAFIKVDEDPDYYIYLEGYVYFTSVPNPTRVDLVDCFRIYKLQKL